MSVDATLGLGNYTYLLLLRLGDALPVALGQALNKKGVGPSAIPLQKKGSTHLRHHCLWSTVADQVPLCDPLNTY